VDFPADLVRLLNNDTKWGMTRFQVLLTAFFLFLHQLTGSRDLTVRIPAQNRTRKGFDKIFGLLVNSLIIRMKIDVNASLFNFRKESKNAILTALDHQKYPYEMLYKNFSSRFGNHKKKPLHQTYFNCHNYKVEHRLGAARLKLFVPVKNQEVLPLSVDVFDNGAEMKIRLLSTRGAFNETDLRALSEAYLGTLKSLLTHSSLKVKDLASTPEAVVYVPGN
jgi:non-ribosomal peptide synthetase component F